MLLRNTRLLAVFSLLSTTLSATYKEFEKIVGEDFTEHAFTFETFDDPTRGRVDYVNKATAERLNLTYGTQDRFFLRADSDSPVKPKARGRPSVRLKSRQQYRHHVAVFNIHHMPTGCGTWPAVWQVGPNWPKGGEIDILEGVNDLGPNAVTLHTGPGCFMAKGRFDGKKQGQKGLNSPTSYGKEFNKAGGGYYALERSANHIKVWFWSRSADNIPEEVEKGAGTVDPDTWGEPDAWFPSGNHCKIDEMFAPQSIIINLTFCGDWAGGRAYNNANCPGSCREYVDKNPHEFKEAFFEFGSLRTYIP